MKYDGAHMQLMVHGKPCSVSTVETFKDENAKLRIRITAHLTPKLDKAIADAWNKSHDGPIGVAFNGGKAIQSGREETLQLRVEQLEREIREVRGMLAKRTLGIVPDIDTDLLADLDEEE